METFKKSIGVGGRGNKKNAIDLNISTQAFCST